MFGRLELVGMHEPQVSLFRHFDVLSESGYQEIFGMCFSEIRHSPKSAGDIHFIYSGHISGPDFQHFESHNVCILSPSQQRCGRCCCIQPEDGHEQAGKHNAGSCANGKRESGVKEELTGVYLDAERSRIYWYKIQLLFLKSPKQTCKYVEWMFRTPSNARWPAAHLPKLPREMECYTAFCFETNLFSWDIPCQSLKVFHTATPMEFPPAAGVLVKQRHWKVTEQVWFRLDIHLLEQLNATFVWWKRCSVAVA